MKTEYCYLMHDGTYYKIGKSVNPKKRLSQLKTGNVNIQLINYSNKVAESYLHNIYKEYNIDLEWYDLNNEQVSEINYMFNTGDLTKIIKEKEFKLNRKKHEDKLRKQNEDRILKEKEVDLIINNLESINDIFFIKNDDLKLMLLDKWTCKFIEKQKKDNTEIENRIKDANRKHEELVEEAKKILNFNDISELNSFEYNPFKK